MQALHLVFKDALLLTDSKLDFQRLALKLCSACAQSVRSRLRRSTLVQARAHGRTEQVGQSCNPLQLQLLRCAVQATQRCVLLQRVALTAYVCASFAPQVLFQVSTA